jgi:hypothetical protein
MSDAAKKAPPARPPPPANPPPDASSAAGGAPAKARGALGKSAAGGGDARATVTVRVGTFNVNARSPSAESGELADLSAWVAPDVDTDVR